MSIYADPIDYTAPAAENAAVVLEFLRLNRESAAETCARHRPAILAGKPPVSVLQVLGAGAAPEWAERALAQRYG